MNTSGPSQCLRAAPRCRQDPAMFIHSLTGGPGRRRPTPVPNAETTHTRRTRYLFPRTCAQQRWPLLRRAASLARCRRLMAQLHIAESASGSAERRRGQVDNRRTTRKDHNPCNRRTPWDRGTPLDRRSRRDRRNPYGRCSLWDRSTPWGCRTLSNTRRGLYGRRTLWDRPSPRDRRSPCHRRTEWARGIAPTRGVAAAYASPDPLGP